MPRLSLEKLDAELCKGLVRKKQYDKSTLASECETSTSLSGVLAGLTFTASTFIFSFRNSFPYGDIFLTLTLISTICFIYEAFLYANASGRLTVDNIEGAKKDMDRADHIGIIGFVFLLVEIPFIAFCAGLPYGIVVSIAVILGFFYFLKD